MTRVLFVDDEIKVLRGLQRMLAAVDCDWETEFVSSGREALDLLKKVRFDILVSDMRMPEMDGATLLNEVMRLYPHVVRVVLSGHSESESVFRAVGAAHQYLAKPCDPNELVNVIQRATALRKVLTAPKLRSLVSKLSTVPSMPQTYHELLAHMNRPDHSLKDLGQIVSRDIGMSAKILQIVNSAFFGLPRHVPDPAQAVCLLGAEVLRALVMTVHIFSELSLEQLDDLHLHNLWSHSMATGALAKRIAASQECNREACDRSLIAGLLHDTGKLILAVNLTCQYRDAMHLVDRSGVSPLDAERQVFGATHAEVGAYLLGLWGLPDSVVEAVAFHHRPSDCLVNGFSPLAAVHVADALEHARKTTGQEALPGDVDAQYLARLGVSERWGTWQEQCVAGARR